MRHGLYLPPMGDLAEPRRVVDLAVAAEAAGWDGFFLWDHIWRPAGKPPEVGDAWVTLSAVATSTTRLHLGPMVTPLARRRPQKVAREAVALDRLSRGRLILGVGLGVNTGGELERFGEAVDDVRRGDILDEALELVMQLWSGDEVDHRGHYFRAQQVRFLPGPTHAEGIPIWGAAKGGGAIRPLRRAARLNGLFPVGADLVQLGKMLDVVRNERGSLEGFDVAMLATPGMDVSELKAAGVTWAMWAFAEGHAVADILAFIGAGPPE